MGKEMANYGKVWEGVQKVKPYLAIVALQFGYAGMYIISMVSLKHGMSNFILVVYRHAAATIAIAPFALVLERKVRPRMTVPIFLRLLALGFLEPVIDQNLYYLGMKYTTTTFASASVNVVPAATFIMAVIFRIEKIKIKEMSSKAKVLGTIVTMTGAMVMTLYKGPIVDIIRSGGSHGHSAPTDASADRHWFTGTLMLLGSACGWSGFFILQSFTLRMYPAELSMTGMICFLGMVQSGAVALVVERDPSAWAIGWDSRLLASVYSGLVCSGMAYYVQGVVSKARGPVFVTAFTPLCMIITFALGTIILSEQIHVGSIIGAFIIVMGLYSVVWGKSKDPPILSIDEKAGTQELPIVNTAAKSTMSNDNNNMGEEFVGVSGNPPRIPPSQG